MIPVAARLTAGLALALAPVFGLGADEPVSGARPAISVPSQTPPSTAVPMPAIDSMSSSPAAMSGASPSPPLSTPATPASVPVAVDPDAAWRQWHGVLFRVTPPSPDGTTPASSYVFGSIHYGTLAEIDIDPADVKTVMAETRTLVDEADANEKFDTSYDGFRYLSPLSPLPALIGTEAFDSLRTLLPGQMPDALRRYKPWLVLALLESRGEVAGPDNLDGQVAGWARDAGLHRADLESLREQMQALDCVPAAEHAEVLKQRIAAPWVLREQSADVLGFYRNRDLVAWMDEVDSMSGLDPRARGIETRAKRCLIDARNARWIGRLDPMLKAGSCFVAVGAIHLMGESGLLNQLAQRGYTVVAQTI